VAERPTIRGATPEDAGGIARVHIESWRSTYAGIVPARFLAGLSIEQRQGVWQRTLSVHRPDYKVFVAEDAAGQVIGFADGGPERTGDPRYPGELFAIYLLAGEQRQGTGSRLVQAVAEHLRDRGMPAMLLWVLAENPARRFYEAIGGRELRRQPIDIGGAKLEEIAYGWDDLTGLIGALRERQSAAGR
jgi:GNAT superfamily N-acetyltransferase